LIDSIEMRVILAVVIALTAGVLAQELGMSHAESNPGNIRITRSPCGDNLFWSLSKNVLTVSGTGNMTCCGEGIDPCPWSQSSIEIYSIVIE